MVHGYNSHKLKTLEANAGQCVGLAFIKMAMFFNNGDTRVNEIAAQNAFYCIAKNFLVTGNTTALPVLFTLLIKKTQTLEDELYAINPDSSLVGLGGMTLSASSRRKTRVIRNAICIMGYLLPKFYDVRNKTYIVDQSLPYHIPTNKDIARFYEIVERFNVSYDKSTVNVGEEYFEKLYNNIEEQLNL